MRTENKLNTFIGKTSEGEFVFVDYAFSDWEHKGLVFSIFNFHTMEEKEKTLEDLDFYEMWKESVASYMTTQGLDDRTEDLKEEYDPYDDSYRGRDWLNNAVDQAKKEDWINYSKDATDCIWGGRLFKSWMLCDECWEWLAYPEAFQELEKLAKEYGELE